MAACGAPIVGWLAERLGFDSSDSTGGADADVKRAKALGVKQGGCMGKRCRGALAYSWQEGAGSASHRLAWAAAG